MAGQSQGPGQPSAAMPAATGPHTRNRPAHSPTLPTREDLAKETQANLSYAKQAREYLDRKGYAPRDEPTGLPMLSYSLHLLASCASGKALIDGIKAVATLLNSEIAEKTSDLISTYILNKLSPTLDRSEQATEKASEVVEEVRKASDRLYNTCEEARDEVQQAVESLNSAVENQDPNPPTQMPNPKVSYVAALGSPLPISHSSTLARSRARDRQVLIDYDTGAEGETVSELTEKELVAKANAAVQLMSEGMPGGEGDGVEAIGAKRLKNGGIVYEFNTSKSAQWIKEEHAAFEHNFGGSISIKDRAVLVIVEFVPISFSPDALAECRKIERESDIKQNSLISTRWIKPIQRQSQGQRSAHLIARLRTPEAANKAIREGLIIAGKRTWARRMKKEPRRCLKCQRFDSKHIAATCEDQNTCGTCGKDHRTAECTEHDPSKFHCTNCKSTGHTSWDRDCPIFVEACKRIETYDPENSHRFFPCNDPWTWEQKHAKYETEPYLSFNGRDGEERTTDGYRQAQQNKNGWADEVDRNKPWQQQERRNTQNPNPPMGTFDQGWAKQHLRQITLKESMQGKGLASETNKDTNPQETSCERVW